MKRYLIYQGILYTTDIYKKSKNQNSSLPGNMKIKPQNNMKI